MMVFVLYMKNFFSKLCYLYVNFFSRQLDHQLKACHNSTFSHTYVLRRIG